MVTDIALYRCRLWDHCPYPQPSISKVETHFREPRQKLIVFLFVITASIAFSACAIRTQGAEHYFGPVIYTTGRHAAVQSMSEQIHFPFLAEAGTQWGLSVGITRRLRAVPLLVDSNGTANASNQYERLTTWGGLQISPNTFVSLFYLRATSNQPPQFLVRSIIGASVAAGSEHNAIIAGIKHLTEFRPSTSGIHYLCYKSTAPYQLVYLVSDKEENYSASDCGRISPP